MMNRKIYAVFVAGGTGTRMGTDMPKQFLELDGVPVLQRTISRFIEACPSVNVITVLPKEHFRTWKELCLKHAFNHPQKIVAGGITRFHSVKAALRQVPDGAVVAIQDGVRPLLSVNLIRRMLERMETCRAVIPALPVTDSLKYADGTLPEPDRTVIVGVQTPQMFLSEEIRAAYETAYEPAFTDDASVAARKNIPLTFEKGERFNIKITTPEDLVLAQALISSCNL